MEIKSRIIKRILVVAAAGLLLVGILLPRLLKRNAASFYDNGVDPAVQQYLAQRPDRFDATYLLQGGEAAVAMSLVKASPDDIQSWYLLTQPQARQIEIQEIFTMDPAIEHWIFREDNATKQYSCFEFHKVDGRDMVFIMVVPNYMEYTAFALSKHADASPQDSLGTVPLYYADSRTRWGNPTWIFVVPMDRIDENYTLQYESFVLTGAEILDAN